MAGEGDGDGRSDGLRTYPAPWKGHLVMACAKCQRKLKGSEKHRKIAKVKAALARCAERADEKVKLRVVQVGCLKLCPKGGVAITTEELMRRRPAAVGLLRSGKDVAALYQGLVQSDRVERTDLAGSGVVVSEAGLEPATVSLEG